MFTGIIESLSKIVKIEKSGTNLNISFKSNLTSQFSIDQSLSHNGICLTIVKIKDKIYTVNAIKETILKSNIGSWAVGDEVNIERAMKIGDRLDGHMVQGHVDQVGVCVERFTQKGSWIFTFEYKIEKNITVEKGSISVNGVSLTVVNSKKNRFSVAIIPYTFNQTCFKNIKKHDFVNLEFDIIGKYIKKIMLSKNT
tara:strand:+ start:136 stop:726 length:591 start_codon:yes stop_codon:yes gene_type:complete